jgi:hypothetical protein
MGGQTLTCYANVFSTLPDDLFCPAQKMRKTRFRVACQVLMAVLRRSQSSYMSTGLEVLSARRQATKHCYPQPPRHKGKLLGFHYECDDDTILSTNKPEYN